MISVKCWLTQLLLFSVGQCQAIEKISETYHVYDIQTTKLLHIWTHRNENKRFLPKVTRALYNSKRFLSKVTRACAHDKWIVDGYDQMLVIMKYFGVTTFKSMGWNVNNQTFLIMCSRISDLHYVLAVAHYMERSDFFINA